MAKLPAKVAAFLKKARTERNETKRQDALYAALAAVDFPEYGENAVPMPEDLTPAQRALAEELCDDPALRPYAYAMPLQAWARRRWLGHEPGGELDKPVAFKDGTRKKVPLWRALWVLRGEDWNKASAFLDAQPELPFARHLARHGELALDVYRYSSDGESWGKPSQIKRDHKLKSWARDMFARLVADSPKPVVNTNVLAPLFLAAARNGVPIPPELYPLLPLDLDKPFLFEVVAAISDEERPRALAIALKATYDWTALMAALELLPRWPSAEVTQFVLDNSVEQDWPQKKFLTRLKAIGRKHRIVAQTLARFRGELPVVELHTTAISRPRTLAKLSPLQRRQLERAALDYHGRKVAAAKLFGEGDEALHGLVIRTIADAKGKHVYDAFGYNGDSGKIFAAGTVKVIASVIQFGVDECADLGVAEGLKTALAEEV
jgi:hypothetical protein